jgi:hypothetical protein
MLQPVSETGSCPVQSPKRVGVAIYDSLDSYFGGDGFESRPRHSFSQYRLVLDFSATPGKSMDSTVVVSAPHPTKCLKIHDSCSKLLVTVSS